MTEQPQRPLSVRRSSTSVVYAALAGNLAVALAKTAAAAVTGSSAMTSEAIHSFVDCGNELLLLHGIRRSGRGADHLHPLGYGRELYFWSFVVALLVFALGACLSVWEGVSHIRHPEPIRFAAVNYMVLALAFVFEGASWLVSFRQFAAARGELGFYEAFRRSKDPPSFMVLFEDSAALLGILVAAIGSFASVALHRPVLDGVASIVIGLILAGTAALLVRESKSLLIGETADQALMASILDIARSEAAIAGANGLMSVQMAPDQVVVALSLEFADDLKAPQIEEMVCTLEDKVRAAHPEIVALFVKPQTDRTFQHMRRQRFGEEDA